MNCHQGVHFTSNSAGGYTHAHNTLPLRNHVIPRCTARDCVRWVRAPEVVLVFLCVRVLGWLQAGWLFRLPRVEATGIRQLSSFRRYLE
jgi:hypothetical protein